MLSGQESRAAHEADESASNVGFYGIVPDVWDSTASEDSLLVFN